MTRRPLLTAADHARAFRAGCRRLLRDVFAAPQPRISIMATDATDPGDRSDETAVCRQCGATAVEWCEYPWGCLCLGCDADESVSPVAGGRGEWLTRTTRDDDDEPLDPTDLYDDAAEDAQQTAREHGPELGDPVG